MFISRKKNTKTLFLKEIFVIYKWFRLKEKKHSFDSLYIYMYLGYKLR